MPEDQKEFVAYGLTDTLLEITPAKVERSWMSPGIRAAMDRCLPIRIANQYGWFILNQEPIDVVWHGGDSHEAVEIRHLGNRWSTAPVSHFGGGILTWRLPYLFKTEPGFNLMVCGPMNHVKDGIVALNGIVETDWSPASFTMNWKLTRPGKVVSFQEREPICMLIPQRRGELETFAPSIRRLSENSNLEVAHNNWAHSRKVFVKAAPGQPDKRREWQKHYFQGVDLAGSKFHQHQTKLKLSPFATASPQDSATLGVERSEDPCSGRAAQAVTQGDTLVKAGWCVIPDCCGHTLVEQESFENIRRRNIWRNVSDDERSYFVAEPSVVLGAERVGELCDRLRVLASDTWGVAPGDEMECRLYVSNSFEEPRSTGLAPILHFIYDLSTSNARDNASDLIVQTPEGSILERAQRYSLIPPVGDQLVVFSGHIRSGIRTASESHTGEARMVIRGYLSPVFIAVGSRSADSIQQMVESCLANVLDKCPRFTALRGFVTIHVQISPDGAVSTFRVLLNQFARHRQQLSAEFLEAIKLAFRQLQFGTSLETTKVTFPIVLQTLDDL